MEIRLRERLVELEESEEQLQRRLEEAEEAREEEQVVTVTEGRPEEEERQEDVELRDQVNSLKLQVATREPSHQPTLRQIRDLESEVHERSEELESVETGYRSEVSPCAPRRQ